MNNKKCTGGVVDVAARSIKRTTSSTAVSVRETGRFRSPGANGAEMVDEQKEMYGRCIVCCKGSVPINDDYGPCLQRCHDCCRGPVGPWVGAQPVPWKEWERNGG